MAKQTKSEKEVVKGHLDILKFLRDTGPNTMNNIVKSFSNPPSTTRDRVNRLLELKWIKKYEKKYAYYDYDDFEFEILSTIEMICEGNIPEKIQPSMMDTVAEFMRVDKNDPVFLDAWRKVIRKNRIGPHLKD